MGLSCLQCYVADVDVLNSPIPPRALLSLSAKTDAASKTTAHESQTDDKSPLSLRGRSLQKSQT